MFPSKNLKKSLSAAAIFALSPFFVVGDEANSEADKIVPAAENSDPKNAAENTEDVAKKAVAREMQILQLKKAKLESEIALEQLRARERLSKEEEKKLILDADKALLAAQNALKFAEMDEAKARLEAQSALNAAKDKFALLERNAKVSEAELDSKIKQLTAEIEMSKIALESARAEALENNRGVALEEQKYLKEPFVDGTLYISDRRIDFNGPVTDSLAVFVTEQILLLNNKSTEFPIFIVIDSSPGGSVFAGYQILKAIESSKAPVIVVVKNYAASMAAIVTTSAPRSFCYENSIILHHQASSDVAGNMTSMKEQYDSIKDWVERIFSPVLKKVGKTQEEFVKEMYEHFSTGDWMAFGKDAHKMRWVDEIAEKIVETSVVKRGKIVKEDFGVAFNIDSDEKIDSSGNAYVELPKLQSGDAWRLFDPENRYREAR